MMAALLDIWQQKQFTLLIEVNTDLDGPIHGEIFPAETKHIIIREDYSLSSQFDPDGWMKFRQPKAEIILLFDRADHQLRRLNPAGGRMMRFELERIG